MSQEYFSDLENGPRPRISEDIPLNVRKGIHAVINKWYSSNAFIGVSDREGDQFTSLLSAEIPNISWPLSIDRLSVFDILDLIQFCFKNIELPSKDHYDLLQHSSYPNTREIGQFAFLEEINSIFKRNGIIYELNRDGSIIRLAPEGVDILLQQSKFHTGDSDLDALLNTARIKFLDPNPDVRKESLEKLWDAWERLKTIESGDKKTSIASLLEKVSPTQKFREKLNAEAIELTKIGNEFRIRHSETNKIPIMSSNHVDYLFHRLFSLIYLILKSTDRIK